MKNQATSHLVPIGPDYILGGDRFQKFSAVEGIFLSGEEEKFLEELAHAKLPNDERRSRILARIKEVA